VEVILIGREEGTAEAGRELGVRYWAELATTPRGTPIVRSAFETARRMASRDFLAYVNTDIILLSDFASAVRSHVLGRDEECMMFGRRTDVDLDHRLDFQPGWEAEVLRSIAAVGSQVLGGADYFVFPRNLYTTVPPFAIGRGTWDIWLVNYALSLGIDVMDASGIVQAFHQNHDYSHLPEEVRHLHPYGRRDWESKGVETDYNKSLVTDRSLARRYHCRVRALVPDAVKVLNAGSAPRLSE
jgi:hypothetical protein